jgi:hypothetical protein
MEILITLIILSVISLFIPHNDKKYNFSWHFRLLITLSLIYGCGYVLYKIVTI